MFLVSLFGDLLSPGAESDVVMEEGSDNESDPSSRLMDDADEPLTPDSDSIMTGCRSENGDMQDPDQDQDTSDRMIRYVIMGLKLLDFDLSFTP